MSGKSLATLSTYADSTFSAPKERCRRFTGWVLTHAGGTPRSRVLEIGCGTGSQLFHLAAALPDATFTGVDISERNVDLAKNRARELGLQSRIKFVASDYLELPFPVNDLIISYSTLHLIPCDSRLLFGKISSELIPGGLLMNVMPYECAFNTLLSGVRAAFAAVRSPLTDLCVFRLAKLFHGHRMDDKSLKERVPYMYQKLERLDGPALRKQMNEECALEFVTSVPEIHASLAQAKHRLIVSRKRGSIR